MAIDDYNLVVCQCPQMTNDSTSRCECYYCGNQRLYISSDNTVLADARLAINPERSITKKYLRRRVTRII